MMDGLRRLLERITASRKADQREQAIHDVKHQLEMTRRMRITEGRQDIKRRVHDAG